MAVDRTRRFSLPGIQDLNKDQDAALALPLEGQHLIVGGPGTGKSVVALLRARTLAEQDGDGKYRVLVYNHLLHHANQQLFGHAQALRSRTWDTWFRTLYKHLFRAPVPLLAPQAPGGYRGIDWEAVRQRCEQSDGESLAGNYFLLIDEGQDMPATFYRALVSCGLLNFFVVADQNQQLDPQRCSSRQDIENCLGIESSETLELRTNYRNTRAIAALARHFYPDDPASPRPELPPEQPAATPELWSYDQHDSPSFAEVITRILALADRHPGKLIGIITPDRTTSTKYLQALQHAEVALDHGKPPIQTYASGEEVNIRFDQGGIVVLAAQSCKGLEFDTVVLADIDQHRPKTDLYVLKSRFYVMAARAREQIVLLRTGERCPVVESLLPADPGILSRR